MRLWWLLLVAGSAHAAGGEFLGDLFTAGLSPGPRARIEQRLYEKKQAAGRSFGLAQTRFDGSVPLNRDLGALWKASVFADYDSVESGAVFSSGRKMPTQLWDLGAGLSRSKKLDDGRTLSGSLAVSSPSDKPFSAGRDLGFNLNLSYQLPQSDGNMWILFLTVSNTRGFLSYVPLPGAAYYFKASAQLRGLVGVPFAMLFWTPSEKWNVTLFVLPLRTGELRVTYGIRGSIQPYALTSFRTRNYRLADRTVDKEKIFYEEGIAQVGVNIPFARGYGVDIGGGQSFARRYYLAERSFDRSSAPRINPDNALYAQVKVGSAF